MGRNLKSGLITHSYYYKSRLGDRGRITSCTTQTPVGTYLVNYGAVTSGLPNTSQGILTVSKATYNGNEYKRYVLNSFSTNAVYLSILYDGNRTSGELTWQRIDNFGCSTPADLASLLGALVPISNAPSDLNSAPQGWGAFECLHVDNVPENFTGFIFFINFIYAVFEFQIALLGKDVPDLYIRLGWGGTWRSWQHVSLT